MSASLADLAGRRLVVTHADAFMGPAFVETFRELGADVVADTTRFTSGDEAASVVRSAEAVGPIDALVVHLAVPASSSTAVDADDDEWRAMFAGMVDPLRWLVRAALPAMIERRRGKVLCVGSASALRGMKRTSSYSAARGAQLAYVQAVGVEVARHRVQVNAIAQNFVDNPTYFPASVQADPRFAERLAREVPLGRLVSAKEDAMLAAYLCSDAADCFVGQVFPMSGGWVVR